MQMNADASGWFVCFRGGLKARPMMGLCGLDPRHYGTNRIRLILSG